jgi:hypothetical protein
VTTVSDLWIDMGLGDDASHRSAGIAHDHKVYVRVAFDTRMRASSGRSDACLIARLSRGCDFVRLSTGNV